MFEIIHIRKDGLFFRSGKFRPIDRPLYFYLRHTPVFQKDLTVLEFMTILKSHENEVDNAFMSYTRGFLLQSFYKEAIAEPKKDGEPSIDFLEFSWSVDVSNFKEFGKPSYEISEYVRISGRKSNDKQSYGISFTNISTLANAKFKLDKKIEYGKYDHGELWYDKKIVKKTFLKGSKEFTFGDVIGSFLNEISYFGYPENRDE